LSGGKGAGGTEKRARTKRIRYISGVRQGARNKGRKEDVKKLRKRK